MAYPTPAGFLNNSGRLGSDAPVAGLDHYANQQQANYMLTSFKQAVAGAANELAMSEPQVIRGSGGHGGDVDIWSMLSVDKTQTRGGGRVNQPRLFATTPALKWGAAGQYNPDVASQLMSAPHTRVSRAAGEDVSELQGREIGLANPADHARLAGLGTAIDMYGTHIGESTRNTYE